MLGKHYPVLAQFFGAVQQRMHQQCIGLAERFRLVPAEKLFLRKVFCVPPHKSLPRKHLFIDEIGYVQIGCLPCFLVRAQIAHNKKVAGKKQRNYANQCHKNINLRIQPVFIVTLQYYFSISLSAECCVTNRRVMAVKHIMKRQCIGATIPLRRKQAMLNTNIP